MHTRLHVGSGRGGGSGEDGGKKANSRNSHGKNSNDKNNNSVNNKKKSNINKNNDKVSFPNQVGGSPVIWTVVEILQHDNAMWHLRVIK